MRPWRRNRKTHCPLCGVKLVKNDGKKECPKCNLVVVGDSCRFVDLPQLILGRHESKR